MPDVRVDGVAPHRPRRWSFAGCVFDEAGWSLQSDGRRVAIETKPLELLRELLARAGSVVSKDQLLDAIWPDVTVVEASLPTAVYKLRTALGDNGRERRIIETVPGLGYRISIPVQVEEALPAPSVATGAAGDARAFGSATADFADRKSALLRLIGLAGLLASASTGLATLLNPAASSPALQVRAEIQGPVSQRDAGNALRRLDVETIERMLAAGWNPNTPFDTEGSAAIGYLLNMCEWDREHDQRRMLLMVRTLIDGGANFHHRNIWGDTPYSIAKADRYCGPAHPVTRMIRNLCASGPVPIGDRCLASYALARGERF